MKNSGFLISNVILWLSFKTILSVKLLLLFGNPSELSPTPSLSLSIYSFTSSGNTSTSSLYPSPSESISTNSSSIHPLNPKVIKMIIIMILTKDFFKNIPSF